MRNARLTDLYKLVAAELRLNREAVPERVKGSRASRQVLQSMTTAVQSLADLRNELGIGHGRTAPSTALGRHARLATNAAHTVVEFVLETWHDRKAAEPAELGRASVLNEPRHLVHLLRANPEAQPGAPGIGIITAARETWSRVA